MFNEIYKFKKVSSTQDVARRLIGKQKELVVFSLSQTSGRGRYHRRWFSPPGGLYLSILLFPKTRINAIPLVAALTVIKTLEFLKFKNLSILWPNDVLLNKKKVCGILCERYKNGVICGIGLNVNIKKFPESLPNATSLYYESGKKYSLSKILKIILKNMELLYVHFQNGELKINEIYNYITGIGEMVEISNATGIIRGTVFDVDEDWSLLIRDENGVIRKFYYGDVRRLKW